MRAVVIDRFGGPEELHEVTDRAVPQPRSGQLQVKVIATGLNPLDYKQRDGSSKSMAHLTAGDFPIALGRECSGTISALGPPGVTGWEVGEEVMAFCNDVTDGSYAEYVCTPADMTTRIPAGGDRSNWPGCRSRASPRGPRCTSGRGCRRGGRRC